MYMDVLYDFGIELFSDGGVAYDEPHPSIVTS